MPRVGRDGTKLYLVDDAAVRWRVHDVIYAAHRPRRVPLGDPRANHRYFVANDGPRRAIALAKASRALNAETLAAQLAGAGYVRKDAFDPSEHRAR